MGGPGLSGNIWHPTLPLLFFKWIRKQEGYIWLFHYIYGACSEAYLVWKYGLDKSGPKRNHENEGLWQFDWFSNIASFAGGGLIGSLFILSRPLSLFKYHLLYWFYLDFSRRSLISHDIAESVRGFLLNGRKAWASKKRNLLSNKKERSSPKRLRRARLEKKKQLRKDLLDLSLLIWKQVKFDRRCCTWRSIFSRWKVGRTIILLNLNLFPEQERWLWWWRRTGWFSANANTNFKHNSLSQ